MEKIYKLSDIRQMLRCGLELLGTAEQCVRDIYGPLRRRPFSMAAAKRLWNNLRKLCATQYSAKFPTLLKEPVTSRRRSPPDSWFETMKVVAKTESLKNELIIPIVEIWTEVRRDFENDCVKAITPLFTRRMHHDPDQVFCKRDVLRWAWAIRIECISGKEIEHEGLREEIEYLGTFPLTNIEWLQTVCRDPGVRVIRSGAEAALKLLEEVCLDYECRNIKSLAPTSEIVLEEAIRIVELRQPRSVSPKNPELLATRIEAHDLNLPGVLERTVLEETISRELKLESTLPPSMVDEALEQGVANGSLLRVLANGEVWYLSTGLSREEIPDWNEDTRELRFRGRLCKRFQNDAPRQIAILQLFHSQGWPPYIDNPYFDRKATKGINSSEMRKRGFNLSDLNGGMDWLSFGITESSKKLRWTAKK